MSAPYRISIIPRVGRKISIKVFTLAKVREIFDEECAAPGTLHVTVHDIQGRLLAEDFGDYAFADKLPWEDAA